MGRRECEPPPDDTLALATMGRGIYTLSGAARALEAMKHGCQGATATE